MPPPEPPEPTAPPNRRSRQIRLSPPNLQSRRYHRNRRLQLSRLRRSFHCRRQSKVWSQRVDWSCCHRRRKRSEEDKIRCRR